MSASRRPFRIEGSDPSVRVSEHSAPIGPSSVAYFERIYGELSDLRTVIERMEVRDLEARARGGEALLLGVEAIQGAIQKTRAEISSLHKSGKGEPINRASDELDAVVADTESATETILGSAEVIDGLASKLSKISDEASRELIAEIQDQTIRIFEACNFQDITGQRISKVVGVLQFIEQRVNAMTEIWGVVEHNGVDVPAMREKVGDEALLNGPALNNDVNVVSQDDIDSLFP